MRLLAVVTLDMKWWTTGTSGGRATETVNVNANVRAHHL